MRLCALFTLLILNFNFLHSQLPNQLFHYDRFHSWWENCLISACMCTFIYMWVHLFLKCGLLITALGFLRRPLAIVAAFLTALSIAFLNDRWADSLIQTQWSAINIISLSCDGNVVYSLASSFLAHGIFIFILFVSFSSKYFGKLIMVSHKVLPATNVKFK